MGWGDWGHTVILSYLQPSGYLHENQCYLSRPTRGETRKSQKKVVPFKKSFFAKCLKCDFHM